MTIEEKARAYDEALKRAKAAIDVAADKDLVKGVATTIFPELRESEDERIRKEIVEFIEWSVDRHFMREDFHQAKRPSEWIAYLEKQKYDRMKPIYDARESFESALEKAWKAYNDSGARTVDGCEDDYVECAHAKGFREGYLFGLEKPKEHKPKIIIPKFRIGEYIKPKPYNEEHLIKDINENGYVLDVDFVVPFKDEDVWEVVEQKPAWSEEDEDMFDRVLHFLNTNRINERGKVITWVKSLPKRFSLQPKQEWSEEDEK